MLISTQILSESFLFWIQMAKNWVGSGGWWIFHAEEWVILA